MAWNLQRRIARKARRSENQCRIHKWVDCLCGSLSPIPPPPHPPTHQNVWSHLTESPIWKTFPRSSQFRFPQATPVKYAVPFNAGEKMKPNCFEMLRISPVMKFSEAPLEFSVLPNDLESPVCWIFVAEIAIQLQPSYSLCGWAQNSILKDQKKVRVGLFWL